ncbi:hypothetical protein ACWCQW_53480 [Streptomyces mirabilis]
MAIMDLDRRMTISYPVALAPVHRVVQDVEDFPDGCAVSPMFRSWLADRTGSVAGRQTRCREGRV